VIRIRVTCWTQFGVCHWGFLQMRAAAARRASGCLPGRPSLAPGRRSSHRPPTIGRHARCHTGNGGQYSSRQSLCVRVGRGNHRWYSWLLPAPSCGAAAPTPLAASSAADIAQCYGGRRCTEHARSPPTPTPHSQHYLTSDRIAV
jgi:hypothetical protein